jgi:predicted phage terminase large subunit-like protein
MYYVVNVVRDQWSVGKRNKMIDQTAMLDNQTFPRMWTWMEEEGGSAGKEVGESFKERMRRLGLLAATQRVTDPKNERIIGFAAAAEAGSVRLVAGPWNRNYIDELCMFPNGSHDDQVDATSLAFNKLAKPAKKVLVA